MFWLLRAPWWGCECFGMRAVCEAGPCIVLMHMVVGGPLSHPNHCWDCHSGWLALCLEAGWLKLAKQVWIWHHASMDSCGVCMTHGYRESRPKSRLHQPHLEKRIRALSCSGWLFYHPHWHLEQSALGKGQKDRRVAGIKIPCSKNSTKRAEPTATTTRNVKPDEMLHVCLVGLTM